MAIWKDKLGKRATIQYAAIFVVGFAILAQLTFSGFTPIKNIALQATGNIAGVIGIAGSVAPNEYSDLAAQIDQKGKELTLREQTLTLREQALFSGNDGITLDVLFGITGLLLLLISLNFYYDWRRGSSVEYVGPAHPHQDEMTTRL